MNGILAATAAARTLRFCSHANSLHSGRMHPNHLLRKLTSSFQTIDSPMACFSSACKLKFTHPTMHFEWSIYRKLPGTEESRMP